MENCVLSVAGNLALSMCLCKHENPTARGARRLLSPYWIHTYSLMITVKQTEPCGMQCLSLSAHAVEEVEGCHILFQHCVNQSLQRGEAAWTDPGEVTWSHRSSCVFRRDLEGASSCYLSCYLSALWLTLSVQSGETFAFMSFTGVATSVIVLQLS